MRVASLLSLITAAAVPFGFGGCAVSSTVPPVTPAMAAASGESVHLLETGRTLFGGRCTACHSADAPKSHSQAEWVKIVDSMAERAKLTSADRAAVLAYVAAAHNAPAVQ